MLKFFYNGIKANGGKLQKASYSDGKLMNYPAGTITIYKKEYAGFSIEIAEAFEIDNQTDSQTDYFDKDKIRVVPFNAYYAQVKAASDAQTAAWEKFNAKRMAKWAAKRAAAEEARTQGLQTLMMDQRRRAA